MAANPEHSSCLLWRDFNGQASKMEVVLSSTLSKPYSTCLQCVTMSHVGNQKVGKIINDGASKHLLSCEHELLAEKTAGLQCGVRVPGVRLSLHHHHHLDIVSLS